MDKTRQFFLVRVGGVNKLLCLVRQRDPHLSLLQCQHQFSADKVYSSAQTATQFVVRQLLGHYVSFNPFTADPVNTLHFAILV